MNKNLFLTASMLVNFINHKHLIIKEFKEKLLNIKKSEKTVVDNLNKVGGLTPKKNIPENIQEDLEIENNNEEIKKLK